VGTLSEAHPEYVTRGVDVAHFEMGGLVDAESRAVDLFMSLIHTAELCGASSFDYLTELQRHAQELAANPAPWMPWNYRETLRAAGV
jgi:hypothetical protein